MKQQRNAALDGPVIGTEPEFLRALPIDRLVGAVLALTGEVYVLRDRLAGLEAELAERRVVPTDAVERRKLTDAEREARAADLEAFTHRVLSELSRPAEPTSSIDPRVVEYLKTWDELRNQSG